MDASAVAFTKDLHRYMWPCATKAGVDDPRGPGTVTGVKAGTVAVHFDREGEGTTHKFGPGSYDKLHPYSRDLHLRLHPQDLV